MDDLDLRYAKEQTRKAMERLDQALTGYPIDLTEHDGRGAIRSAFLAAEAAVAAVEHDINLEREKKKMGALKEWAERRDPELRWEDDRIERAEEARAREEA